MKKVKIIAGDVQTGEYPYDDRAILLGGLKSIAISNIVDMQTDSDGNITITLSDQRRFTVAANEDFANTVKSADSAPATATLSDSAAASASQAKHTIGYILYCIAAISAATSFYKLWFYKSPESTVSYGQAATNAYVGGDAYNYIINGTFATAYAVLAVFFLLAANALLKNK